MTEGGGAVEGDGGAVPLLGRKLSHHGSRSGPLDDAKARLGLAAAFLLVYNFSGFAPTTVQYLGSGEWRLDPFYMLGQPYDIDFTILNHHAHLGLMFIGFAVVQVLTGATRCGRWSHRRWGYFVVTPLAVLVVGSGAISEIQDGLGPEPKVIMCLHLLAGFMGLTNLVLAVRAARSMQYRRHAELVIYALLWIGYPGEGRLVGFLMGFLCPCSIASFSGFAFVAQLLNAALAQLIVRCSGSKVSAPWALAANTGVMVAYAAVDALQASARGRFWSCPGEALDHVPEEQVWWMLR